MLTTQSKNRTSIQTLLFLTGWCVGGVLLTNPHYVRPSVIDKGLANGNRTSCSNDMPSSDGHNIMADKHQSWELTADSIKNRAASLSSSLCSSIAYDHAADRQDNVEQTAYPKVIEHESGQSDNNFTESQIEAQSGTIDSAADLYMQKRIGGRRGWFKLYSVVVA